jgi:hypothetical protein
MVAMESADARLATLHDPGVSAVRSEPRRAHGAGAAPQPDVAIVTRIGRRVAREDAAGARHPDHERSARGRDLTGLG